MILLLFDVDGTLTDTSRDDARFFAEALREVAGVTGIPEKFEVFDEVTAPAIARELIGAKEGRRAREGEIFRVREAVTARWRRALESNEVSVRPTAGGAGIIGEARSRNGVCVAIASGAWGPPTLMKLQAAGLPVDGLVLVSADDSETRRGILNTASIEAAAARGIPGFETEVLVGDGVWDARAARANGMGFVGVATGEAKALRLRAEGAAGVVPDFADTARFWGLVDQAVKQARGAKGN